MTSIEVAMKGTTLVALVKSSHQQTERPQEENSSETLLNLREQISGIKGRFTVTSFSNGFVNSFDISSYQHILSLEYARGVSNYILKEMQSFKKKSDQNQFQSLLAALQEQQSSQETWLLPMTRAGLDSQEQSIQDVIRIQEQLMGLRQRFQIDDLSPYLKKLSEDLIEILQAPNANFEQMEKSENNIQREINRIITGNEKILTLMEQAHAILHGSKTAIGGDLEQIKRAFGKEREEVFKELEEREVQRNDGRRALWLLAFLGSLMQSDVLTCSAETALMGLQIVDAVHGLARLDPASIQDTAYLSLAHVSTIGCMALSIIQQIDERGSDGEQFFKLMQGHLDYIRELGSILLALHKEKPLHPSHRTEKWGSVVECIYQGVNALGLQRPSQFKSLTATSPEQIESALKNFHEIMGARFDGNFLSEFFSAYRNCTEQGLSSDEFTAYAKELEEGIYKGSCNPSVTGRRHRSYSIKRLNEFFKNESFNALLGYLASYLEKEEKGVKETQEPSLLPKDLDLDGLVNLDIWFLGITRYIEFLKQSTYTYDTSALQAKRIINSAKQVIKLMNHIQREPQILIKLSANHQINIGKLKSQFIQEAGRQEEQLLREVLETQRKNNSELVRYVHIQFNDQTALQNLFEMEQKSLQAVANKPLDAECYKLNIHDVKPPLTVKYSSRLISSAEKQKYQFNKIPLIISPEMQATVFDKLSEDCRTRIEKYLFAEKLKSGQIFYEYTIQRSAYRQESVITGMHFPGSQSLHCYPWGGGDEVPHLQFEILIKFKNMHGKSVNLLKFKTQGDCTETVINSSKNIKAVAGLGTLIICNAWKNSQVMAVGQVTLEDIVSEAIQDRTKSYRQQMMESMLNKKELLEELDSSHQILRIFSALAGCVNSMSLEELWNGQRVKSYFQNYPNKTSSDEPSFLQLMDAASKRIATIQESVKESVSKTRDDRLTMHPITAAIQYNLLSFGALTAERMVKHYVQQQSETIQKTGREMALEHGVLSTSLAVKTIGERFERERKIFSSHINDLEQRVQALSSENQQLRQVHIGAQLVAVKRTIEVVEDDDWITEKDPIALEEGESITVHDATTLARIGNLLSSDTQKENETSGNAH